MQESQPRNLTEEELRIANSTVSIASFSEPTLDVAEFHLPNEFVTAKPTENEVSSPETALDRKANLGDEAAPSGEPPQP